MQSNSPFRHNAGNLNVSLFNLFAMATRAASCKVELKIKKFYNKESLTLL